MSSKGVKLRLTTSERSWIERQVAKKSAMYAVLGPKQLKLVEKEANAWFAMNERLLQDALPGAGESSDLSLSRQELRLLQVLVIERLAELTAKTIPSYEARITKYPEKAASYQDYLDAAIGIRQGLMSLTKKIGDVL